MSENAAEDWVSLREFSRRRGVSHRAVQKAIESGRVDAVRRDRSGRIEAIDAVAATRQWNANTDPDQAARAGQGSSLVNTSATAARAPAGGENAGGENAGGPGTVGGGLPPEQNVPPAQDGDEHGYLSHRAKTEEFKAKRAELDYFERLGFLVSVDEVKREQYDIYRQHRDKLEQIPVNLSERLAAETDPQRTEHLLRTAIRNTLNELSRRLALDAAAEGAAESSSITV